MGNQAGPLCVGTAAARWRKQRRECCEGNECTRSWAARAQEKGFVWQTQSCMNRRRRSEAVCVGARCRCHRGRLELVRGSGGLPPKRKPPLQVSVRAPKSTTYLNPIAPPALLPAQHLLFLTHLPRHRLQSPTPPPPPPRRPSPASSSTPATMSWQGALLPLLRLAMSCTNRRPEQHTLTPGTARRRAPNCPNPDANSPITASSAPATSTRPPSSMPRATVSGLLLRASPYVHRISNRFLHRRASLFATMSGFYAPCGGVRGAP